MKKLNTGVAILATLIFTACGAIATDEASSDESTTTTFPSGLAVASPTDYEEASASSLSATVKAQSTGYVPRYTGATAAIDRILNGNDPDLCVFDPDLFLSRGDNAECYGPIVEYENHPDASGGEPNDGNLPPGDLGLWSETDEETEHACAAAELNARMEGARDKTRASLSGLATMICTINSNSLSLPSNSELDITAEMNDLGISGVTFNEATLAHSDASGSDQWTYHLDLNYTTGGNTYDIIVDMDHVPGATVGVYQGRMSYLVNDSFAAGNCPSDDKTINGSILYNRASDDEMAVEMREGIFCQHDSDGRTDGVVDASQTYDAGMNPDGWSDGFSILTASYDPSTLEGDYAFSWQAGSGDSNSRVFNVHVADDESATAFYGYGDPVDDSDFDNNIDGFICNWAGPGGDHDVTTNVQYQTMSFNSTTGKVEAGTSNIGYAPVAACSYDGTGSFTYDSDLDGAVDTDPAAVVDNDLLGVTDADVDGIFDEIEAAFTTPTAPENL